MDGYLAVDAVGNSGVGYFPVLDGLDTVSEIEQQGDG